MQYILVSFNQTWLRDIGTTSSPYSGTGTLTSAQIPASMTRHTVHDRSNRSSALREPRVAVSKRKRQRDRMNIPCQQERNVTSISCKHLYPPSMYSSRCLMCTSIHACMHVYRRMCMWTCICTCGCRYPRIHLVMLICVV